MFEGFIKIFEVCIAMVTAILGLAYPMFVERINAITDKYNTRHISDKFKKEPWYKCFNILIILCVIEMFVFPLLIMVCNAEFWYRLFIIIQGTSVFALSIVVIRLYHLLIKYSDPYSFFNYIMFNENDEEIVDDLQVLIVVGANDEENDDLYYDAMHLLKNVILEFQQSRLFQKVNANSPNDKNYMYPAYIMNVFQKLMRCSVEKKNVILNKRTDLVDILYSQSTNFPITEQVYNKMWNWINSMAFAKHDDWLKQYWSNSNSYYVFHLTQSEDTSAMNKFQEFSLMVCVMLLYQKKYDVLQYVLTFTNSYPPKYPLIPSTFSCIFEYCETFPPKYEPFYLSKYHMFKEFEGANEENKIEGLFLDYLALLMIRLNSVNDYNITFSEPLSLPNIADTIEENKYKLNRIDALTHHLDNISCSVIKALDWDKKWKREAKNLLQQYKEECNNKLEKLSERKHISKEKLMHIKDDLIKAIDREYPFLPQNDSKDKMKEYKEIVVDNKVILPNEMILDNCLYRGSNLCETMIRGLYLQLQNFYNNLFFINRAVKTYTISYRDSGKALERLCLSNEYAILAMGVPQHFFYEIK